MKKTIKKITTEDIMKALRESTSAESEGTRVVYYLHITADGEIVDSYRDADETFTASRDQHDYFGAHDDEYPDDWGACCAATEDDPDSDFWAICDELADKANAWLTEQADEAPAALSIDNGATYIEADDEDALQSAIDTIGWDEIVSRMDDDAREQTHSDVAPCTELEYLKHYLEIAPCDLVIG